QGMLSRSIPAKDIDQELEGKQNREVPIFAHGRYIGPQNRKPSGNHDDLDHIPDRLRLESSAVNRENQSTPKAEDAGIKEDLGRKWRRLVREHSGLFRSHASSVPGEYQFVRNYAAAGKPYFGNLRTAQYPARRKMSSGQQQHSRQERPEHQAHRDGERPVDFRKIQPRQGEDIDVF